MRRPVLPAIAALLLATLLTACGGTVIDLGSLGRGIGVATEPAAAPGTAGEAVQDLQQWWAGELPTTYGVRYRPLPPQRVRGVGPGQRVDVRCQGQRLSYRDVQGNAFAAQCPEGIAVLWDAATLFPELERQYGPAAGAVVLAHEWGHVAQFQAGVRLPTVYAEQQADCFAGAWVAAVAQDPPPGLEDLATDSGRVGALATLISVRDPLGTDPSAQGAHGSGFDRVRAFQEGYEQGTRTCAAYAQDPPALVRLPFNDVADQQSQGNAPLADLVQIATTDLDAFSTSLVEGFTPIGTLQLQSADPDLRARLEQLYRIGDSAPATLLALLWAQAAQQTVEAPTEGADAALQRACLAGGWFGTILRGQSASGDVTLSPGDLDESILGLLSLAGDGAPEVGGGEVSGYDLTARFRQGVLQGPGSCGLGTG